MIKKSLVFSLCLLLFLTGCGDITYIEKTELSMVMGLDKTDLEQDLFDVYSIAPIFEVDAPKKYIVVHTKDHSLRNARKHAEAKATGMLSGRKLQIILLSKSWLKEESIYPYLDVLFRDPKNEINAKVVVTDGPVSEIIQIPWEKQGQPGLVLRDIVEQAFESGYGLITPLYQYRQQVLDPRMTPMLTEIKKDQEKIAVEGTALLGDDGKYKFSLDREESSYLILLQKKMERAISIKMDQSLPVKNEFQSAGNESKLRQLVFEVRSVDRDVKTSRKKGKLVFDINMNLDIYVEELPFPYDIANKAKRKKFEEMLNMQLKEELEQVVDKLQQHEVEPIGLGYYVQAQQYPYWLQIKEHWVKDFAQSEVNIYPEIKIHGFGVSM